MLFYMQGKIKIKTKDSIKRTAYNLFYLIKIYVALFNTHSKMLKEKV